MLWSFQLHPRAPFWHLIRVNNSIPRKATEGNLKNFSKQMWWGGPSCNSEVSVKLQLLIQKITEI